LTARLSLAALVLLFASPASAFVRTTTCTSICHQACPVDGACEDGGDSATAVSCEYGQDCADCGWRPDPSPFAPIPCTFDVVDGERVFTEVPQPIYWPTCFVGYHVNDQGYSGIESFDTVFGAIETAFDEWNRVETAGFAVTAQGISDRQVPVINDQNLVTFVESDTCLQNFEGDTLCGWNDRAGYAPGALALASVSFDPANGEIVDVDLEVNAANWEFRILDDGPDGTMHDLQNTLTHEIGHFLGLDHCHGDALTGEASCETVTMRAQAELGDTSMRSLSADDTAGVTEIYPLLGCEQPERDDPPKGCRCSASGRSGPAPVAGIALGLLLLRRPRQRQALASKASLG
jgi:MYXO-CTERM domain-containing protein